MSKLSPTLKVLLTLAVIASVSFVGIRFLNGKNFHFFEQDSAKYYAVFQEIGDLEPGNRVKMNGLEIGQVIGLEESDEELTGIKVTIKLTRNIRIPANSIAYVNSAFGGLSPATVIIERGNSKTTLKNGETIQAGGMYEPPGNQNTDELKKAAIRGLRDFLIEQDSILHSDTTKQQK